MYCRDDRQCNLILHCLRNLCDAGILMPMRLKRRSDSCSAHSPLLSYNLADSPDEAEPSNPNSPEAGLCRPCLTASRVTSRGTRLTNCRLRDAVSARPQHLSVTRSGKKHASPSKPASAHPASPSSSSPDLIDIPDPKAPEATYMQELRSALDAAFFVLPPFLSHYLFDTFLV